MAEPAILALEDGTVFKGVSVGAEGRTLGEVVFNTAMTGYQEILTDPSYYRQIVTLTYPHIGNVGTNSDDFESTKTYAAGPHHSRPVAGRQQLARRRRPRAIPAARQDGRDRGDRHAPAHAHPARQRRAGGLHRHGRESERRRSRSRPRASFPGSKGMDLAKLVTTKQSYQWNQGSIWPERQSVYTKRVASFHVVAFDYGIKRNILRLISDQDCRLTVVPATTKAEEVMALLPDGVFLSNGPGDPEPCDYAIEAIRTLVDNGVPTFGICLGHQLLGLASGAKTEKMKFGHHGANHPVVELDSGRVMITSQNHGFAVQENTLPANVRATHRSLFDGSLQGIERTDRPAFSFQGHPEASPGPARFEAAVSALHGGDEGVSPSSPS